MDGSPPAPLDAFSIGMGLVGGLALFLYGMDQMSAALKAAAGERLKRILARLTSNRFAGVLTGAFVTSVIQSSSVTTVLTVGFISAGLMTLAQGVGVIMGANIGTTITAQIIAFKVTKYALLLVAGGFLLSAVGRRSATRHYGLALLGLGLLFIGMGMMGDAMAPLGAWPPFLDAMTTLRQPALAVAVAAVFTAVVQSSSAATGIIIVMASQGLVTLDAGIAMVLGTNVGTCITAIIASWGRPREAMRAAAVHVLFNLLGVVLWVWFIPYLAEGVVALSPQAPELEGQARLAAETPRQIANAHSLFNVANTLIFLPFTGGLAAMATWLLPDREAVDEARIRAKYLDQALLGTPALALERARLELSRLVSRARAMLVLLPNVLLTGSRADLEDLQAMDEEIDGLHSHIVHYLGEVSRGELTDAQTQQFVCLLQATNAFEALGDVIETNLAGLGMRRIELDVTVSPQTQQIIRDFHRDVVAAFDLAAKAALEDDAEAAAAVLAMKEGISRAASAAGSHEIGRLVAPAPKRLATYAFETDVIENYMRLYYFAKRAARAVVRHGSAAG